MKRRSLSISLQYLNTVLGMICGFFLSAFLLRTLGDTEYGLYQTIGSFVNYLVLLEFGTGTVLTRNIAASRANSDKNGIQKSVSTIWTITSLLVVVILIVGMVLYSFLGTIYEKTLTESQIQYGKEIFLVILCYLITSFYGNTLNGILLGYEKYEAQPVITLSRLISRTILLVVFVIAIKKSIVIAVVDLSISLIIDVILIIYCRNKLKINFSIRGFDKGVFLSSFPLSMAIFIQALVNQANSSVDKFVIGIRLGPEDVAVYSVGLFVYSVFSSMTTIPISMYSPQVVKEIAVGYTPNDVSTHLIQPSRLIVLIGGTILFGFLSVGKQFVSLVYGKEYTLAWFVALIIMFPMLMNMSNGIMINILDATNKRMARSAILLITTIANIILTIIWIEKYGVIGACTATAICTLLGQILLTDIYYYKRLHIKVLSFKIEVFKGILICQIVTTAVAYIISQSIGNTLISFFVGGVIYVVLFSVLFYFFGASKQEKLAVRKLLTRLTRISK